MKSISWYAFGRSVAVATLAIMAIGVVPAVAEVTHEDTAALAQAQMQLQQQNREEITTFGVLALVNSVIVLPLGIGIALVFVGLTKQPAKASASPWRTAAPWLVLGAVVWLDVALMGQTAINASLLNRYEYGAHVVGQVESTLEAPGRSLESKVQFTGRHLDGPRKIIFQVAFAGPSVVAIIAAVAALVSLGRRMKWTEAKGVFTQAWGAVCVLTALVLATGLPQLWFAAVFRPGG